MNAFIQNGFDYKGIHYKALSARTLSVLNKMNSQFFSGGGNDQIQGLMDFLFVSSKSNQEVISLLYSEDPHALECAILDYSETLTVQDIAKLTELVSKMNDDASSAIVEIVGDNSIAEKK